MQKVKEDFSVFGLCNCVVAVLGNERRNSERYWILWQTQKSCFEHTKVEKPKNIHIE